MTFTRFGAKILCIFLFMSLVPLAIAGTIVYKNVYDMTRGGVLRQLRSTAQNLNIQLNLLLSQRRIMITDFSSDGFIRDSVERMSLMTPEYSSLRDKLNFHLNINKKGLDSKILDIEILDTKGTVIASTLPEQIGKDRSPENYFKTPFLSLEQKGSYFAHDLERTGVKDELSLVFSTILKDRIMQSPLGVIATKVNGSIIQDVFNQHMFHPDEESSLGPFGEIYIVNSNNIMIANSSNIKSIDFKQIITTKPVQEVFLSHNEWSGVYKNYKGIQVLGTVLFVPETNWVILAEIDVDGAFLSLVRIRNIFAISGVGVFLMVIIFAIVISNNTSNIIRTFVVGLRKVAGGNYEYRIKIGRRRDEIQTLANSFNFMTEKLKKSKELECKFDEFKMLGTLTEKINAGLTLEEVLNYIFEHFHSIIPYDGIGFALLVDNGTSAEAHWARTKAKEVHLTKGFSVKLEESSLGDVIRNNKPRIINDLREYLKAKPQSVSTSLMVQEGMLSSLTCPLIALGNPIGFIFFSSFKIDTYSSGHVEVFRQIAEKLAVILEKSRLYQQLMELNELKNGFMGMAAHDLRNPNILVKLYLNQLVESLQSTNEIQRTWIAKIQNITSSMMTMIDDFMDISIIEAGQLQLDLESVSLNAILTNSYKTNRLIAEEKSIILKADLENELPMVNIDSDKINQVLNNLIINAKKYSVPNTKIILKARVIDKEVVVSVIDQGQGIHPDDFDKLFKMFGKTRGKPTAGEKSTGLGLVICKHIVDAHGGRIWVESEGAGKGSVFRFALPLKSKGG